MSRMRGAAIVLAMLIAALAAAVAATVFADQQRWLRTVEHRRDQVQAQALAMAGVLWTRRSSTRMPAVPRSITWASHGR